MHPLAVARAFPRRQASICQTFAWPEIIQVHDMGLLHSSYWHSMLSSSGSRACA